MSAGAETGAPPRRRPRRHDTITPTTTRFTLRGSRNGSLVQVTWAGGSLSGDFPTCDLIEIEAAMAQSGQDDAAYGPLVRALYGELPDEPLADPRAAFRVMAQVLDSIREVEAVHPDAGD